VAITGSAGKTTTKELTAAVLSTRYRVLRNTGNLNNHLGLPLSLLELRRRPDVGVMELGMSAPGEIRLLVGLAEPEVRVWTNVAEVHAAFFASLDAIADAKAEILDGATRETTLVANAADPRIMTRVARFPGRVITFGVDVPADVAASRVRDLGLDGSLAIVRTPAGEAELRTPLLGRGNLANVLAAIGVGLRFGVPLDDMVERVAICGPASRRGEILRLPGGVVIVDDSYNSNPTALERALEPISQDRDSTRKIAVLGEMLELGERTIERHQACGRVAAQTGLAALVTVGGAPARALAESAVAAGMPASAVVHFATSTEAADWIARLVTSGDLVLVKGSRGVGTDRVVDRLKAEFT
jgi:UDP-N-acetylmuramoyl-tripeptide--D-alanyl-D-alanine ligase